MTNYVNPFQLYNHTKKIESISFLKGYVVVVLKRCRVNFILGEMCNRIKMTMSIPSKVNCAITLERF